MAPGTLSAAIIALASAVLDALALFGVFGLTADQKTAIITVVTAATAVAVLLIPYFQHNFGMTKLSGSNVAGQNRV